MEVGIFGKLPRSSFSTCAPPSHIVLGNPSLPARPMEILLQCATDLNDCPVPYDGMDSDIAWMLDDEKSKIADPHATYMVNYFGWSFYSFLAEVCLLLAHRLDLGDEKQSALVEEGLRLAGLAEAKMKDEEGNITNCTAFKSTNRIHSELRNFNNSNV